jgi:hypothetical protein
MTRPVHGMSAETPVCLGLAEFGGATVFYPLAGLALRLGLGSYGLAYRAPLGLLYFGPLH